MIQLHFPCKIKFTTPFNPRMYKNQTKNRPMQCPCLVFTQNPKSIFRGDRNGYFGSWGGRGRRPRVQALQPQYRPHRQSQPASPQPLLGNLNRTSYNIKKGPRFFRPQPGCHFRNPPWPGIISLFPSWESLVRDIPAGEGKTANLFLQCNGTDIYLGLISVKGSNPLHDQICKVSCYEKSAEKHRDLCFRIILMFIFNDVLSFQYLTIVTKNTGGNYVVYLYKLHTLLYSRIFYPSYRLRKKWQQYVNDEASTV